MDILPGIRFTTLQNDFDELPPNSFFSLSTGIPQFDGKILNSLKDGAPLTITTDPGVLALGVDVFSLSLDPEGAPDLGFEDILFNVTIAGPNGTYEVYGLVDPTPGEFKQPSFIGFLSAAGTITELTLTPTTSFEVVGIDNVAYAPVPEPSTMLLLGFGLVGLGFFGRRKIAA